MNKYDLEYIDKLRIHELRDYARKLGVSSPTTMKKEELIGRIISIVQDKKDDCTGEKNYLDTNQELDFFSLLTSDNSNILADLLSQGQNANGSTSNKNSKVSSLNTIVMKRNKEYGLESPYSTYDDVIKLSFCINQNSAQYGDSEISYVSGYVDIHPSGYGILRFDGYVPSERDCYMTSSLVKKHNLKKGNFIQGKAKPIMENKPKIVFEIESVDNNVKANSNYDELNYNGIGDEYYLEKFDVNICKGERHYFEKMSISDAVGLGLELVEENSTSVKFINIKARPEDNYKSIDKLQIINVPFNTSEIEVVNTVELTLERIKREFEFGKQNILMIYNFSELIRIFNIACEGCVDFNRLNSKAINKVYNILYLSKFVSDNLCSSVICIDNNGVPRDLESLMELELLPLFNKLHLSIEKH